MDPSQDNNPAGGAPGETPGGSPSDSSVESVLIEWLDDGQTRPEGMDRLCEQHPELADELRERYDVLVGLGLIGEPPAQTTEDEVLVPRHLGDYRLLDRVGGGGMGVVYSALQVSIERVVAVKLVRPEQLFFAGALERFQREVDVVSRLSHPGIVPIHGVGEEQGVPYFAMEFVRGATLGDILAQLHPRRASELRGSDLLTALGGLGVPSEETSSALPMFAGSWEEACLRIARAVAEALDHAHRAGVLHRDVKPSNIMLTPAGRVMLVDFGLATAEDVDRLTRTGSQVGSLPYMAPEVLTGSSVSDGRVDTYSLGVTLYELLTLELPYPDATSATLARRVEEGRAPAPRTHNPSLSWEAETVCLVAMEPAAERRYRTPEDLARDLSNVLSGHPIVARRPDPVQRLLRFARRRPAVAASLLLGFLLIFVAPALFAWREYHSRLAYSQALAQAEQGYEEARAAVQRFLTETGRDDLNFQPHVVELRRELLEEALPFYERFLEQRADDPAALLDVLQARIDLSEALLSVGRYEEALGYLSDALESATSIPREDDEFVHLLTKIHELHALHGLHTGRQEEVERWYGEAIEYSTQLVERRPEDRGAVRYHGKLLLGLADSLQRTSSHDWARDLVEESLRFMRRARELAPEVEDTGLLTALTLRSIVEQKFGGYRRALEWSAQAKAEAEELLERHPRSLLVRRAAARAYSQHGSHLHNDGAMEEAVEDIQRGVDLAEGVYRDLPGERAAVLTLISCLHNLGYACIAIEDPDRGQAAFRRCVEVCESNAELVRSSTELTWRRAAAEHGLAETLRIAGRFEEAIQVAARAWPRIAAARELYPERRDLEFVGQGICMTRAECLVRLGRHREGTDVLQEIESRFASSMFAFESGRLFAMSMEGAENEEDYELSEAYAERALDCLEHAARMGYSGFQAELIEGPEFERLHYFPRYEQLVDP